MKMEKYHADRQKIIEWQLQVSKELSSSNYESKFLWLSHNKSIFKI